MKISELDIQQSDIDDSTSFYISFSDLMIMLGVFFVMLISISEVEVGSFEKVKVGFSGNAGGTLVELSAILKSIVEGSPGVPGVTVDMASDGVRLNLDTATVFATASAKLKPDALAPLQPLLEVIMPSKYTIDVEGHTDDVPLYRYFKLNNEQQLETNWSLSGRRASSVIHFLIDFGFDQQRLRLVGYASTKPIAAIAGKTDKALALARAENRRVSLLIK